MRRLTIFIVAICCGLMLTINGCSAKKGGGIVDQIVGWAVEKMLGEQAPLAQDQMSADDSLDAEDEEDWDDEEADSTVTDSTRMAQKSDSVQVATGDSLIPASTPPVAAPMTAQNAPQPPPATSPPPVPGKSITESASATSAGEKPVALPPPPAAAEEEELDEETAADDSSDTEGTVTDYAKLLSAEEKKRLQGPNIDYKALRNPFDFDPYGKIEPLAPPDTTKQLPPIKLDITLNGIMWNEKRRMALITGPDGKGYFISIGDKIKGAIVEDIQPDRVIFIQKELGFHEQRLELKLKKEEGS